MITHMTNVDCGKKNYSYYDDYGIHNIDDIINKIDRNINFIPEFIIQMKQKSDYKTSFQKIIQIIKNNNVNPSNLNIEIISSLPNDCFKGIKVSINKLVKKLIKNMIVQKNKNLKTFKANK